MIYDLNVKEVRRYSTKAATTLPVELPDAPPPDSTDSRLDSAKKRDFSAFSDFINNLNVCGILGI